MITITADFERQNDSCQGTQEGRSPGLSSTKRLKAGFAMAHVKETTRATLMMLHGFCMSMLGMLLLHVRETMAHFYAFGCALAMLLIAASLIMLAALDWICVVGQGAEQASKLRGILSISVGAAFGGVVLALYPGATISLFCYLIAFYALLLSFAKFNLARYWSGPERARIVMYVLAAIALLFGMLMVIMAGWDARNVIALLAFYSLFMGAQMLLTIFYLHEGLHS